MPRRFPTGRDKRLLLHALRLVLLILSLAGCGASSSSAGAGNGPGQPPSHGTGMALRPCPGPFGSATDVGSPALVLSPASPQATPAPDQVGPAPRVGSAHVGDLVQVRLPITEQWDLSQAGQGVALLQPAGLEDRHLGVCLWTFRALSVGDVRLAFTGMALCEPNQPCPLHARIELYLVHVS